MIRHDSSFILLPSSVVLTSTTDERRPAPRADAGRRGRRNHAAPLPLRVARGADEAVERMIRDRLASQRPDDAIVGEELGAGEGVRRWIIDPIDATKNYVRGIPVFATLIALEEEGRVIAGVVSAPAMQRRWWASRGDGAFCNAQPIHVSRIDDLGQ